MILTFLATIVLGSCLAVFCTVCVKPVATRRSLVQHFAKVLAILNRNAIVRPLYVDGLERVVAKGVFAFRLNCLNHNFVYKLKIV